MGGGTGDEYIYIGQSHSLYDTPIVFRELKKSGSRKPINLSQQIIVMCVAGLTTVGLQPPLSFLRKESDHIPTACILRHRPRYAKKLKLTRQQQLKNV